MFLYQDVLGAGMKVLNYQYHYDFLVNMKENHPCQFQVVKYVHVCLCI